MEKTTVITRIPVSQGETTNLDAIIARYLAGFYPDFAGGKTLFWERRQQRAVIMLNEQTVARARHMLKKDFKRGQAKACQDYVVTYNTDILAVLSALSNEQIKANSWVQGEVMDIYQTLHSAGHVRTSEAYDVNGQLVGGTLELQFGNVYLAETMFQITYSASKWCLCHLIEHLWQRGIQFMDVQNPHHPFHPDARLGETILSLADYLALLRQATGPIKPN